MNQELKHLLLELKAIPRCCYCGETRRTILSFGNAVSCEDCCYKNIRDIVGNTRELLFPGAYGEQN